MSSAAHKKRPISYYDILQVSPRATQRDIKNAYLDLIRQYHPDIGHRSCEHNRDNHMRALNAAYACLRCEDKRRRYNAYFYRQLMTYKNHRKNRHIKAVNDNKGYRKNRLLNIAKDIFWPFSSSKHSSYFTYL